MDLFDYLYNFLKTYSINFNGHYYKSINDANNQVQGPYTPSLKTTSVDVLKPKCNPSIENTILIVNETTQEHTYPQNIGGRYLYMTIIKC